MAVTILGRPYEVQIQYHYLNNITYVLLDAPVFRGQTKSEPYVSSSTYYLTTAHVAYLSLDIPPEWMTSTVQSTTLLGTNV
jgi:hypothetical protein